MFVHPLNNPSNLEFNSLLFCFMRSWNCPDVEGFNFKGDTWFAVPAVRHETRKAVTFTIINSKIDLSALMIVADTGRLLKAARTNLEQKVEQHQMDQIIAQSFDIGKWEQMHDKPFPYQDMFDGKKMQQRYTALNGANSTAYFSIASENALFTEIKKKVSPKPCNCGKPQYIG